MHAGDLPEYSDIRQGGRRRLAGAKLLRPLSPPSGASSGVPGPSAPISIVSVCSTSGGGGVAGGQHLAQRSRSAHLAQSPVSGAQWHIRRPRKAESNELDGRPKPTMAAGCGPAAAAVPPSTPQARGARDTQRPKLALVKSLKFSGRSKAVAEGVFGRRCLWLCSLPRGPSSSIPEPPFVPYALMRLAVSTCSPPPGG